ncbi:MAG: ABC transporter permease subunit [Candidatus Cloacimonetes bacterium]|nr:ABC transporter permease subunit [Candidatus Cloacimonadota bacterium]
MKFRLLGGLFVLIIIVTLLKSLGIPIVNALDLSGIAPVFWRDFSSTLSRVLIACLISWALSIVIGRVLYSCGSCAAIASPLIHLVRNISPFAWLPFAIIWFGLGEPPVYFILVTAILFPAIVAAEESFHQIPRELRDEAAIDGATGFALFWEMELPLLLPSWITLLRILWGIGWASVIAAEMLGVESGMGFRLLDFRYLLQYRNMLQYLVIIGVTGIMADILLKHAARKRY